jgi:hypothetical protein
MPPRARESKPKSNDEICRQCWPDGWPEGQSGASCEHGQWSRDLPEE